MAYQSDSTSHSLPLGIGPVWTALPVGGFCSLCLLQPLFFCRDTRQILSSAFLSFLGPRHNSCVPHCSPVSSFGAGAAGLSRSEEPPQAAVHRARSGALVTARGARWHPRRSHGSRVTAPRAAGAWGHATRASRPAEPGRGQGPWPCMPAPEPLPGTRPSRSRRLQPLLSARRRENKPVSRRVARVTFFGGRAVAAAELAGTVCWELGQPLCPHTGVPLPGATQQRGTTGRGMQVGARRRGGRAAGHWRSHAAMKNAKALLELGACRVGEPFWLGLGKSGL